MDAIFEPCLMRNVKEKDCMFFPAGNRCVVVQIAKVELHELGIRVTLNDGDALFDHNYSSTVYNLLYIFSPFLVVPFLNFHS